MRLEAIVLGYGLGPGGWGLTMVPLPCLGTGHTEDSAAIADGHGSQWQQEEAAEGEEVVSCHQALKLLLVTLSEGDWTSSADGVEQEQLPGKRENEYPGCSQKFPSS